MSESTAITHVPQVSGSIYVSEASWEFAQRQAKMLAASFVPREFQGNNGVSMRCCCWCRSQDGHGPNVCLSVDQCDQWQALLKSGSSGAIQGCGPLTSAMSKAEDSCQVVCKRADSGRRCVA